MFAKESCIGSQTLRTAEMACLRCVSRRNKLNSYPFPIRLISGVFDNLTSHPIADSSVVLSGIFAFNRMQSPEILHRYHSF
ncbi:MAG: hypothetical protein OCU22_07425, partial [Canidatus Methanoxibalbensis ujae]|nr:hypothetical protein [Candidatus Methanoxibalbensis ujae]